MAMYKYQWGVIKSVVFMLCLLPFGILVNDLINDRLGANPIESMHVTLGEWALRFLCLTLSLSPCKQIFGLTWLNKFRRMLGLYSFFYALMHFMVYIVLDISLDWMVFVEEINDGPYILFGVVTFLILLPLAITSLTAMQKLLGKNWKKLHSLVYLAAITALLHYFLLVKTEFGKPLFYAAIILLLLGFRLVRRALKKNKIKSVYSKRTSNREKLV